MIFTHPIIGLMPIDNWEFSWFWFIGSIIPDIDHLFVLFYNKIFSWNKFINTIRFEEKYNIHYKTKYLHSILGAFVMSAPILFISVRGAFYFFLAYIFHFILDWPDIDEKQFFYPVSKKFTGFLPIFSITEIILTVLLLIAIITWYRIT